ncbi:MAG: hypothetical protein JST54_11200 [Deltaproteobacteria bacterium]|nr:hypothetical protein [Deltaproteobacteria bacterium]
MSVNGSGDAAAAAAAAAAARAAAIAAQRRAEEEARERAAEEARQRAAEAAKQRAAAEAAQKKAQAAAQKAQAAQAAARQKAQAAQGSAAELKAKQNVISQHPQLASKMKTELDTAQAKAKAHAEASQAAQKQADAASKLARDTAQKANTAATTAIQSEQRANDAAKAAGQPAPYSAANQVNDAYGAANLAPAAQKQLFGGDLAVSDAAKADAARLGSIQNPAQRAQMLQSMVTHATDPVYRKALVTQAGPQITQLAGQIVNKDSGCSTADRQSALNALTATTEKLAPDAQTALASTFAGAMKDQNVGDDSNEFGTMVANSIKAGSGASFGVQLASALQASGKTTAANDTSKFVSQGIGQVKSDFDAAQQKVEDLKGKMGQELATWQLQGKDQTTAVREFDQRNGYSQAVSDLEAKANLLSSAIPGADLAANDPALTSGAAAKTTTAAGRFGVMPEARFSNEGDLLSTAKGAMQDLPKLADTNAGSKLFADAVEAQGEGQQTFLDDAAKDAGKGGQADKFLNSLRSATVSAVGQRLLSSAQSGDFEAESSKLLAGLNANRALFGASEESMQKLTASFGAFKPGMTPTELDSASSELAKQIKGVAGGDGAVSQSLKGLGVLFGAVGAVDNWSHFDSLSVKDKIGTVASTLGLGKQGADMVTNTLTRFTADAASAGTDGAEVAAETAGLTAGKLLGAGLGAIGSVVSGWSAVDDFSSGQIQKGVGDSMSALGGAVATAGLVLDATGVGAEAGVVLNVVGGVISAAGAVVSLFSSPPDPFKGQEGDLKAELQAIGVKSDLADQLNSFNSDGQNTFGAWISQVAKSAGVPTGTFVRNMNSWSSDQVAQFLDAGRLQQGTDSNNDNRLENASAVLGTSYAQQLEDPHGTFMGRGGYAPPSQAKIDAQKALQRTTDSKTGEYVYNSQLVEKTRAWLQAQGLIA